MEQLQLFKFEEQRGNILLRHIAKSPWEVLELINWDFTDEVTQYLTHTFHSYPARFIPQIPNLFIQLFTQEGETVLDPFAGCGTTLVEALLLKRKAIGVDMNPLACLISKVKTTLISHKDLLRIWEKVNEMQSIFGIREDCDVEYMTQTGSFDNVDMKFPNRKVSELFTPEVMEELRTIKNHIGELKDSESLFNLGLVVLSSTIRVVIESESHSSLYRIFRQKIKSIIATLGEMNQRVNNVDVTIIHGDARCPSIPNSSVDLVVTSPPYVNALDYYRVHQYNMAWLGMDYVAFRQQEIGGHSHFIMNRFRLLSEYLGDMLRAMIEMNRVLKHNSVCAIVIGNSSLEYELIESHKFFVSMASDIGFEVKKLLFRNIDVSRKYHNQDIGKIDNEYIVVLQKVKNTPITFDDDYFVSHIVRREILKFKEQVDANPGSSLRGKRVSPERLRQNSKRIEAAISMIEQDIKLKPNGKVAQ